MGVLFLLLTSYIKSGMIKSREESERTHFSPYPKRPSIQSGNGNLVFLNCCESLDFRCGLYRGRRDRNGAFL